MEIFFYRGVINSKISYYLLIILNFVNNLLIAINFILNFFLILSLKFWLNLIFILILTLIFYYYYYFIPWKIWLVIFKLSKSRRKNPRVQIHRWRRQICDHEIRFRSRSIKNNERSFFVQHYPQWFQFTASSICICLSRKTKKMSVQLAILGLYL
jgi:hypothetical protein